MQILSNLFIYLFLNLLKFKKHSSLFNFSPAKRLWTADTNHTTKTAFLKVNRYSHNHYINVSVSFFSP